MALACVLALVAALRLWPEATDAPARAASAAPAGRATVQLDDGESAPQSIHVPWDAGTALELLRRAGERDPAFAPEVDMAMVTAIGGRRNQGAEGRNWLFEVNGRLAEVGAGAAPVRAGDRVLWRFAKSE